MKRWAVLLVGLVLIGGYCGAEVAGTVRFSGLKAEPSVVKPRGKMLLSCRVYHSDGRTGIEHVAANVAHGNVVISYPKVTDDGKNGDKTAGDGIYSILIDVPEQMGEGKATFVAVDAKGAEKESEPVSFTVQ